MAEHKAKYPNYRFRPTHKDREPSHRRRVKEPPPPPDEQRCAEIANLLVCGMKGEVLANKVRELDAIRPQDRMRMRFDEPVTPSTNAFGTDRASSPDKVEEQPSQDEGVKESVKEKRRRSSSAPVPDGAVAVGDSEDTKFIPHTPGRQSRRARTVSSTPSRNRAASSSPVKRSVHRSRGYSLRIETVKEGGTAQANEDTASQQVFVGVFRTNKDKPERPPLPLSLSIKEAEADPPSQSRAGDDNRAGEDSQAQENATATVDQLGILSPPFTPSSDDVFSSGGVDTFSWQALELEQQQNAWTPNTPPTSGQQTSPWTPHTPNLQNLYLDSPLNSPNSNSPFMPTDQVYIPYTAPLTPLERYAPTQYPPQSPFPPSTPISPEFAAAVAAAPSIPTAATHAPIPRPPYIDIPNLTGDFFSEDILQEHLYNYAAEYGSGELDSAADAFGNNTAVYDSGENHAHNLLYPPEVEDSLRPPDLQLYRPSAVLINIHHSHNHDTHQLMGLSVDNNHPIDLDIKNRPLGNDTGAQPLLVAY